MKILKEDKWKCKVCGHLYESSELPKSCIICESKEFEKIENEIVDVESLEPTTEKKKYRRIFKRGFTRKYKKIK